MISGVIMKLLPGATRIVLCSLVCLILPLFSADSRELRLNAAEREWIENHHEITIALDDRHGFDFALLWKIGLPILGVLLLSLYWRRRLSREIRNRKTAEEELSKYRDRLEDTAAKRTRQLHRLATAIDQAAEAVTIVSPKGIISFVNPGFVRITGIDFETAVGSRIDIVGGPLTERTFRTEVLNDLIENGRWQGTIAGRNRNGEEYFVEGTVSAVLDESGTISNIVAIQRDVTKERRMENWLGLALDSVHAGVWEYDINNKIFHLDERAASLIGYTCSTIDRKAWDENVIHREDRTEEERAFSLLIDGTAQSVTIQFRARNQETNLWLHVMASIGIAERSADGSPTRLMGTAVDVSERQHLEEKLRRTQKLEAIGTLAGGIAHDFNNILTAISGYAELSYETSTEEETRDNLKAILESSERARELVHQILTFAKKKTKPSRPIRVSPLIKEAAKLLRSSLPATISLDTSLDEEVTINADETQLHQIVMNLCTNAASSMPYGGDLVVELSEVAVDTSDRSGRDDLSPDRYMRLSVRDTGTGIDSSIKSRIFEPFFTTRSSDGGTGLGLSVTHGIVESYGGTIEVESTPGEGSVFTVFIPAVPPRSTGEELSTDPMPSGNETVLLVDDERAIIDLFSSTLGKLGYDVITARNGKIAIDTFIDRINEIDLVISDVTMPGATGDLVAKRIRAIRGDIPIILCSGYGEHVGNDLAGEIGEYSFLAKPVSLRTLAVEIRKALDSS